MRRIAVVVSLVAASLLALVVFRGHGTANSTTKPPPTNATSSDARAAAIDFVAASARFAEQGPLARREHLRTLTTAAGFQRLADGLSQTMAALASKLEVPVEELAWVEVPLTASDPLPQGAAVEVDVWVVSVLGHRSLGAPQMVWRTVQVSLRQLDGRWLVDDAGAMVGPTPRISEMAEPSSFAEFSKVAGWPPVVRGGS